MAKQTISSSILQNNLISSRLTGLLGFFVLSICVEGQDIPKKIDKQNALCNELSIEKPVKYQEDIPLALPQPESIYHVNHQVLGRDLIAKKEGVLCLPKHYPLKRGLSRLLTYKGAGLFEGDFGFNLTNEDELSRSLVYQTAARVKKQVLDKVEAKLTHQWLESDGYIVDLFYRDKSTAEILKDLSKQTGLSFVYQDDYLSQVLSLAKSNVPLTLALDRIAEPLDAVWRLEKGVVSFVTPEENNYKNYLSHSVYTPSYLSASELTGLVPEQYINLLHHNGESTEILLSGTPRQIKRLTKILNAIDKKPPMLALEAIVADVEQRQSQQLGIDWWSGLQWSMKANGMQLGVVGSTQGFQFSGHNQPKAELIPSLSAIEPLKAPIKFLTQSIKALAERGHATILATPKVITASGKQARIHINTQQIVPVLSGSKNYPQVITKDFKTGVKLEITPVLTRTGDVHLTIHHAGVGTLTLSGAYQSDGNKLPVVTQREISTTINVGNEQILAIGGLLDSAQSDHQKGIPGIGMGTNETKERTRNLMIFIKPTVLSSYSKDEL